ncbi:MAG: hypothetical protein M3Q30_03585, partial [Actinomycetota bacterium]|nr:hypothetical protein [Actinomycetota bacterium]
MSSLSTIKGDDRDGSDRRSQWSYRGPLLGTIAVLGGIVTWWWFAEGLPKGCPNLQSGASFAGSVPRFNDFVTGDHHPGSSCAVGLVHAARSDLVVGLVGAAVIGIVLFLLLAWWLRRAFFTRRARTWVWRATFLSLAAAALDIAKKSMMIVGLHGARGGGSGVALDSWSARTLPILAWPTLVFFAIATLVLVLELIAARDCLELSGEKSPAFPKDAGSGSGGSLRRATRMWSLHSHFLEAAEGAIKLTPKHSQDAQPSSVQGLGVCCSGGGIRAAAIALGVLSSLESRRPGGTKIETDEFDGQSSILDNATYLSSVSGGGYTAAAWRIARGSKERSDELAAGLWREGIIGDPWSEQEQPPETYDSDFAPGAPSLYRHIRARHEYLRTGRGGLAWSIIRVFAYLVLQLTLLAAVVVLVAWPIGRLSRTWYVFGGIGCGAVAAGAPANVQPVAHGDLGTSVCGPSGRHADACTQPHDDPVLEHSLTRARCFLERPGVQMPITWSLIAAPIALGAAAILAFAPTLAEMRTRRRRTVRLVAFTLFSVGAALAILLLGVPVLLDAAYPYVTTPLGVGVLASTLSAGGIAATALRFLRTKLSRRLDILGKLFVSVAAILFAIAVAGQAAIGRGFFAMPARGWLGGYAGYLVLAVVMLGAFIALDPRLWSLHVLYRDRLRNTFSTTREPVDARNSVIVKTSDEGRARLLPLRRAKEPTLDEYQDAPGPIHLVCCSAAWNTDAVSGVPALSFVFSPDEVTLYEPVYDNETVTIRCRTAPTGDYIKALGGRRARQAKGNSTAAAAMSGAAVASAMGRFDPREPTALFATLNLRLGVWMPNPDIVRTHEGPVPKARLSYLLKEVAGYFEPDDRHLYVTDGGHRENLGLVELLRRRCKTIICIDASGDPPGSYATLRQAAATAQIEVGATINLADLANVTPTDKPRAVAHTVLEVTYEKDEKGTIVHLPAEICDALPVSLRAYANEERDFPHYSTGKQFLTDTRFVNLVKMGRVM